MAAAAPPLLGLASRLVCLPEGSGLSVFAFRDSAAPSLELVLPLGPRELCYP